MARVPRFGLPQLPAHVRMASKSATSFSCPCKKPSASRAAPSLAMRFNRESAANKHVADPTGTRRHSNAKRAQRASSAREARPLQRLGDSEDHPGSECRRALQELSGKRRPCQMNPACPTQRAPRRYRKSPSVMRDGLIAERARFTWPHSGQPGQFVCPRPDRWCPRRSSCGYTAATSFETKGPLFTGLLFCAPGMGIDLELEVLS